MRKHILLAGVLAALIASYLPAQNIAGAWQGTLGLGGTQALRLIMQFSPADGGGWTAMQRSIDQGGWDHGMPASSVSVHDSVVTVAFPQLRGSYQGRLAADGKTITGTWTQNGVASPLEYERPTPQTAWHDPSPHTVHLVTVEKGVQLEVLDWGGSGRPLVFLAGLGNSAHIFDDFARKLTSTNHVYGISRRGFGASSTPASGYSADRLGDDVLAVLDSLRINRPVLVGHSIAGEELSSVGSRHPERVAGLIYLDAGYPYAFYDRNQHNMQIDMADLARKLEKLQAGPPATSPDEFRRLIGELANTDLPAFQRDLEELQKNLPPLPPRPAGPLPPPMPQPPSAMAAQAIIAGEQKYTDIRAPVLAIYALPHKAPSGLPDSARAGFLAADSVRTGTQAAAFEHGIPTARVVRLPNADHYVFISNEADVLREMHAFIDRLPPVLGSSRQ